MSYNISTLLTRDLHDGFGYYHGTDKRISTSPVTFAHGPTLSYPERVIDVIRIAAKSVQGARQQHKARHGFLAWWLSLATVLRRFRQVFSERVHSGEWAVLPG